jgi:O-antigen ligase
LKFIKSLFSFESFFVLWLFSYQYKNAFGIFMSPDITVLLTAILVPWGIFLYYKDKEKFKLNDPAALMFLGMGLWFIASSFWSPSQAYKLQKTLCYTIYTIPGFLMGYLIISKSLQRIKRLIGSFFVFSILILGESYRVFFINGLTTISDILNTNYLVTGQTLGVGLLTLIPYSYSLSRVDKGENKGFSANFSSTLWFSMLFLSSLFFYVLINLGGRGPILATVIALTVFYGVKYRQDSLTKPAIHCGVLLIFWILSYFILNGLFDHTNSHFGQRIAPLLTGQIDEAVNERFIYYQSAFSVFLEHPLIGVGFGGWPISHGLGDVSLHPHNIFLEILSETGLIGLAWFMALLYFIFRNLTFRFVFSTPEQTSVALITIFSFINAQKTGDLHDNLLLFFTLSLWVGLKNWKKDNAHHTS